MGNINATNIGIAQMGDHATASMGDQNIGSPHHHTTQPSLDAIKTELAALQKIIAGLKLAEPQKVERALADVADELKKPEPSKEEVAEALDRALKYVSKTGALTAAIQKDILPVVDSFKLWLGACAVGVGNYFLP